jgi:hypothetical protein
VRCPVRVGRLARMTSPQKRKGDSAEREAAAILTDLLGYQVRRKLGAGRTDDEGDLEGLPHTTVEVKNYRDITRAINKGLADSVKEQANAGTTFGAAMIRRPGANYFIALTMDQFATLWREATRPAE